MNIDELRRRVLDMYLTTPCWRCPEQNYEIAAIVAANGVIQFKLRCTTCHRISGGAIARFKLTETERGTVETIRSNINPNNACSHCGEWTRGVELHHWAPFGQFTDSDNWPTSFLCIDCHRKWHETMNGYKWIKYDSVTPSSSPPRMPNVTRPGPTVEQMWAALKSPPLTKWPAAFNADRRPLKVGITNDIKSRMPDAAWDIPNEVGKWVKHPLYIRNMIAGGTRIDLDGQPAGEVTLEQREHAWDQLKKLRELINTAIAVRKNGDSYRTGLTVEEEQEELQRALPLQPFQKVEAGA